MSAPTCLFCKIVSGSIPATIVARTDDSLAFRDIDPQAPTHVLVIPRRHAHNIGELADTPRELADLVALAARVAEQEGLDRGYRMVTNTGSEGGQVVFHAHLHVLGGRPLAWPPG
ncbi:MAG: histidine triad nucleotide-binding protein [Candidatus Phosphoribacter sp.]|nr:histidine triad nucleotide-binding protein [Actinomycetales bacterium]